MVTEAVKRNDLTDLRPCAGKTVRVIINGIRYYSRLLRTSLSTISLTKTEWAAERRLTSETCRDLRVLRPSVCVCFTRKRFFASFPCFLRAVTSSVVQSPWTDDGRPCFYSTRIGRFSFPYCTYFIYSYNIFIMVFVCMVKDCQNSSKLTTKKCKMFGVPKDGL